MAELGIKVMALNQYIEPTYNGVPPLRSVHVGSYVAPPGLKIVARAIALHCAFAIQ